MTNPNVDKCNKCGSSGFFVSSTGRGCTFCDGTEGGHSPILVGIVGHEAAKFNAITEQAARQYITMLLTNRDRLICLVSGGCHLGGADIFAEDAANSMTLPKIIHYPKRHSWIGGYKQRNLLIARDSDVVHNIVVDNYIDSYKGMRFGPYGHYEGTPYCYHCEATTHVKSGGCWTAKKAVELGKLAYLHIIHPDGSVDKQPYLR